MFLGSFFLGTLPTSLYVLVYRKTARDASSLKLVFPSACVAPAVRCVKAEEEPGSFATCKISGKSLPFGS